MGGSFISPGIYCIDKPGLTFRSRLSPQIINRRFFIKELRERISGLKKGMFSYMPFPPQTES
jgi:hypothetical protein